MAGASFILKLVAGTVLCGALGGALGYRFAGLDDTLVALPFTADWSDVPVPTDYSGSRDRIEYELAAAKLFGPARSAREGENGQASANTDSPLHLIAILSLDGTEYALLEETPGTLERLRPGESLASGWYLTAIEPSRIRLRREEEERVLSLFPELSRTGDGAGRE